MIVIDGAQGGGQILRTAVSYSALSGHAVRIVHIRGARPNPGLRPQHLLAVNATAALCGARISGARLGSTDVAFVPGPISPPSQWRLDVGTAGSVMLILQAVLPCLALADSIVDVTLTGGTNNPWAPTFEYLRYILVPMLGTMGFGVQAELVSRGFYPKGGGEIRIRTQPAGRIRPITLRDRGALKRVWGISYSSNLPEHIAQRMAWTCREQLGRAGLKCDEFTVDTGRCAASPGCGIIAFAEFERAMIAGDALGERGKPAEKVGIEAAEALLQEFRSGAPVDTHLGDQLVPWVALADGESTYVASRRSDHLISAIGVAQQVIGAQFELEGGEPVEVRCRGTGHTSRRSS